MFQQRTWSLLCSSSAQTGGNYAERRFTDVSWTDEGFRNGRGSFRTPQADAAYTTELMNDAAAYRLFAFCWCFRVGAAFATANRNS